MPRRIPYFENLLQQWDRRNLGELYLCGDGYREHMQRPGRSQCQEVLVQPNFNNLLWFPKTPTDFKINKIR